MWVLIDNYDSFTYILCDYLKQLHQEVQVVKNDAMDFEAFKRLPMERLIISPGPKSPIDAGFTLQAIEYFHDKLPILGICLGHQALAQAFGARVEKAAYPMHGKTSSIRHTGHGLFQDIPKHIEVMRYHSLVVTHYEDVGILPLAYTEDKELMAFKHFQHHCVGIQFHPESVLTQYGLELLRNWANS